MADRRRQIAALRAKAESSTFPAEAEACRAKADELEALEPAPSYVPPSPLMTGAGIWGDMGGITIRFNTTGPTIGQQVTVTNVQGQTYTVWVE